MNDYMRSFLRIGLVAFPIACCVCLPLFAGGPLIICDSGQPIVWPAGGTGIPFNPDQGDLGPLDHTNAVTFVETSFGVWEAVPTSTATFTNAGVLPVDVNITNFFDYLYPVAPDGLSAIVFDDTGEIFDLLYGPGSGILGFAGPEWADFLTCEVLEGVSFLNGPAFVDPQAAFDVMVHEFGHYNGLAHTVVNGQTLWGDTSGPTPHDTFGPSNPTDVETMYPFYFGPFSGTSTLHRDDIAAMSTLYPTPDFFPNAGTITGAIYASNGITPLTGVNVIARNLADPFADAVSAISGDFSAFTPDPYTGVFTINGLTPGAEYALFVDTILAGGFSTPLLSPLPGPEEFYNGANESNNMIVPDDPAEFVPIPTGAGVSVTGIDVIFNTFQPGDPLPVGMDGFVEIYLPFTFEICGQGYDSVFVNANGNLTFGTNDFNYIESAAEFLAGPPRAAALWHDLNNLEGGVVTFFQSAQTTKVQWVDVPEYPNFGSNTFAITLKRSSNHIDFTYGNITASGALAGVSCGGQVTSGFEPEYDLSILGPRRIDLHKQPAVYEIFEMFAFDFDLANTTARFTGTTDYNDYWTGPNDTPREARNINLPFSSAPIERFTEIEPAGTDVDFFRFKAKEGETLIARIISGQLDSVMGLFMLEGKGVHKGGVLIAVDDDGGQGLLSQLMIEIPEDGEYAVAVSTFPDFAFIGDGFGGGRYVLDVMMAEIPEVTGTVYATEWDGNRIVQYDAVVGAAVRSLSPPEGISGGPDGLSQSDGSLFFVNGFGSNMIHEISAADGSLLGSFPAPVSVNGTDGLASSGEYLYSLDFAGDTIFKIDPETGAELSSCVTGLGAVGGLAGADGRLFATINTIQIAELDPDTCALLGPMITLPEGAIGLAFNGEVLFAGGGLIQVIDPASGLTLSSFWPLTPVSALASSGEEYELPELESGDLLASTGAASFALIQIDPDTGVGEFRSPQGAFGPVTEIEFRDDGVLFGSAGGGSSTIMTIDTETGAEMEVGQHDLGAVNGLEFVGDTLYGTFIPGPGQPSQLVIVDQTTAALTFIGPTGLGPVRGLAYDPVGEIMYGTHTNALFVDELITVDLTTGAGAVIGEIGFPIVSGLEFGPDGVLYGGVAAGDGSLITIDPATGASSYVGWSGFPGISGLAFVP